jgi:hypothetical protein
VVGVYPLLSIEHQEIDLMIRQLSFSLSTICLTTALTANFARAQYAVEVLSYDPGVNPAVGYTNPSTTLGLPERSTGEGSFPGNVTVFNPPFGTDELVSIGTGGHLSLRLSHFAVPDPTGPEIGVFTNTGIADENYPHGQAGNPLFAFGVDDAAVELSADGLHWESLGTITFDIPTQGNADVDATVPSNFHQPFVGSLNDFNGLPLDDPANPDILELLAGSGGGMWLDISSVPLAKVGYIRFSVPADLGLNFELDAVVISASAMAARVPEPSALLLMGLALVGIVMRH